MKTALAALLLPVVAYAAPARMPLPGYASSPARAEESAADDDFLGDIEDPLDELTVGEDLRDAVISPPSPAWLMKGLASSDPAARLSAVNAVAIPRHAAVVAPLTALVVRLEEPTEIRVAAATALGRIGDALAAPSLGEALKDPEAAVRYAAALALGKMSAAGSVTRLSRVMRSDPSWWVRYAAVLSLGRSKKSFVVGALSECLRDEPKWQVRMLAVRSLQDIGGPRAAEAIGPALRDKDSGVRTAAALSLAEIGGEAQLHYLSTAIRVENDPSAHSAEIAAFSRILAKP